MTPPRYPDIRVRLRSRNRFALVAAARYALRRAGVEEAEIERCTEEVLAVHPAEDALAICRSWIRVELPDPPRGPSGLAPCCS